MGSRSKGVIPPFILQILRYDGLYQPFYNPEYKLRWVKNALKFLIDSQLKSRFIQTII